MTEVILGFVLGVGFQMLFPNLIPELKKKISDLIQHKDCKK